MGGPDTVYEENNDDLIWHLNNASNLAHIKIEEVQEAVAKCHRVSINSYGIQIPSLLDSGKEVTALAVIPNQNLK